ncbi:MAG: hypothetical protein JO083_00790 [Candidatus Eremiobacteraeota bacterium]|nr:hypothetical protein [Candidatus Eremiobacteraeota bacterium]MBV8370059.1 hypothetical protein [Candidatus Eremiobacteraeota bacterium]
MHTGIPARRVSTRVKAKRSGTRLNSLETLLVVLSVVALVDCAVIAWLIVRGFAD